MRIQQQTVSRWAAIVNKGALIERTSSWQQSPNEFLLHFDSGLYSCARTVQHRVFDLPAHIDRLVFGLFKQNDSVHDVDKSAKDYLNITKIVNNAFIDNLRVGIRAFEAEFTDVEEIRIYFLLSKPKLSIEELAFPSIYENSYLYLQQLPARAANEHIKVQVTKYNRDSPEVKSIDWMRKKKEIENQMSDDFEECLIADDTNAIAEGLSSNFFAVLDGNVYLAPEGTILKGTVMQLVVDCCESLSIPVIRIAPNLSDIKRWEGCFITSTSRLVLPVHKIVLPEHPSLVPDGEYDLPTQCETITKIASAVREKIITQSTDVFSVDKSE